MPILDQKLQRDLPAAACSQRCYSTLSQCRSGHPTGKFIGPPPILRVQLRQGMNLPKVYGTTPRPPVAAALVFVRLC